MSKKQKGMLIRIGVSVLLFVAAFFVPADGLMKLAVFLIPYLFIGYDVLWASVKNIIRGQVFDENFLMALATIGAFAIGEYPEATFVMLFYQVGEWFQRVAVSKSRRSITELMDLRPDTAHLETVDGTITVSPETLQIGDIIVVKPGERLAVDGVIIEGETLVDTAALTGESLPRDAAIGTQVMSGCVNLSGAIRVKVEKLFSDSTVSKILDMVENASGKKAKAENFITKFARVYTPCVVLAACLLAVIPVFFGQYFTESLHRALIFLVISCPCALVISVPLSFFGGIGGASKCGILIKGSNYLEALAKCETVVFDKTGTLTKGTFSIVAVHKQAVSEAEMLDLAAHAEGHSNHPISVSIRNAFGQTLEMKRVSNVIEVAGAGITALVDSKAVAIGNDRLMAAMGLAVTPCHRVGTVLHMAVDGVYAGHIVLGDTLKKDAKKTIAALHARGIGQTVMLTGDDARVGESVAREIGIQTVHCNLLPNDKVEKVEALLNQKSRKGTLLFVGDGINDAPVLTRADVGIAMGGLGSDAAIEAADVVLMDDAPYKLVSAIAISQKTLRIVKQNIAFALGVKGLTLVLGALGVASMWEATFADVGVSVLAILNAMRAMRTKEFA